MSGRRSSASPPDNARRTVEAMAAFGIAETQIARAHGLSRTALQEQYREELATGKAKADARVVESLYRHAVNGNVSAMIWWTKARLGWRESTQIHLSVEDLDRMIEEIEKKLGETG